MDVRAVQTESENPQIYLGGLKKTLNTENQLFEI
jgi:hypothetical protein